MQSNGSRNMLDMASFGQQHKGGQEYDEINPGEEPEINSVENEDPRLSPNVSVFKSLMKVR